MNAQDCTLEAMDIILSLYKGILPIHGEFRYIGCPSSDSPKGVYMRFISKYFISLEYLQRHSSFHVQGCMFYILLGFLLRMKAHNSIPLVIQGVRIGWLNTAEAMHTNTGAKISIFNTAP